MSSPTLPPLPASPASSPSLHSPSPPSSVSRSPPSFASFVASSPHSPSSPHRLSPCRSIRSRDTTGSPIRLDTTSDEQADDDDDDDQVDDDSSEVEIYLNSLSVSISREPSMVIAGGLGMGFRQVFAHDRQGQDQQPSADESPVLPSSNLAQSIPQLSQHAQSQSQQQQAQPQSQLQSQSHAQSLSGSNSNNASLTSQPQSQSQKPHTTTNTAGSPLLPPAPVQHTIPLPALSSSPGSHSAGSRDGELVFEPAQNYNQNTQNHNHNQNTAPLLLPLSTLNHNQISDGLSSNQQNQGIYSSSQNTSATLSSAAPHFVPSSAPSALTQSSSLTPCTAAHPALTSDPTGRTPNVYINGLPPHFPEDQLLALASPFGDVLSVRTFTRHVRDSESGYGFVLFANTDAAERCIISLRRYRNLHPTYSKQAHKIPGTRPAPPLDIHLDTPPGSEFAEDGMAGGGSAAFKAKMESLHDKTSTNLYMEGFETRAGAEEIIERLHGRMVRGLNDPGSRISVRFADTAEQRELRVCLLRPFIYSYRSCASVEQRNERMSREGEESPARLTIAQAALLNLHGQDLRSSGANTHQHHHQQQQLPVPVGRIPTPRQLFTNASSSSEYRSHAYTPRIGSPVLQLPQRSRTPPFAVDYSLAPTRPYSSHPQSHQSQAHLHSHAHPSSGHSHAYHANGSAYAPHPRGPSPYHGHAHSQQEHQSMDPAMAALLESLSHQGQGQYAAHGGREFVSHRVQEYDDYGYEYEPYPGEYGGEGRPRSGQHQYHNGTPYRTGSGGSNVRGAGYTATEEFIMRAHADAAVAAQQQHAQSSQNHNQQQQHRRRPAPPPLDLAAHNMRRRRDSTAATVGGLSPALGTIPLVGEEEFHKAPSSGANGAAQVKHNHRIHPAHVNARLGRAAEAQGSSSPSLGSANANGNANQNTNANNTSTNTNQTQVYQSTHLRSSTLPHRAAPAAAHATRHFPHSSMSIPSSSATHTQPFSNRSNTNTNQSTNVGNVKMNMNTNMNMNMNMNTNTNMHTDASNTAGASGANAQQAKNQALLYDSGEVVANGGGGVQFEDVKHAAAARYQHPNHHQNQNQNQNPNSNSNQHGRTQSQSKAQHHHPQPQSQPSHNNHSHSHHNPTSTANANSYLDSPTDSPSLVSPALTYSRDSPSTLSPATPFFSGLEPAGMQALESAGKGIKMSALQGQGLRVGHV
ncbi:hypothetical protein H0H87_012669 [Tephrocybe sp. NHM501043]|nr:hypothetical protein H0H87_012669 [Tephrocybe sp. NHM501043]